MINKKFHKSIYYNFVEQKLYILDNLSGKSPFSYK